MAERPTGHATAEQLLGLSQRLSEQEGFAEAIAALSEGQDATLDGVWGSSCALVAAEMVKRLGRAGVLVAVCPTPDEADAFCDDFALFSTETPARFPAWETEPDERILHDEIYADRLRTLKCLIGAGGSRAAGGESEAGGSSAMPSLVVTSIQSLLQTTPDRERLQRSCRRLQRGQRVDVEGLLKWLAEQGFHSTSAVELPGEFSSRGGIVDVFAPDWFQPVRIEFFDDEIESIRQFDISTQRSLDSLDQAEITVVRPQSGDRGHFSEYLPPGSVFLMIELQQAEEAATGYLKRLERPQDFHSYRQVMRTVAQFPIATASGLSSGDLGTACHLEIESVERFSGEIDRVRDELDEVGQGHEVFVVSQTEAEVERLSEILRTTKLAAAGRLHFPVGTLRQGFRLVRQQVIVITSGELFQRGELRRLPRRRLGKAIDSFMDLRSGDLVVHLSHGIGRYRGMQLLDKDGRVEEHLQIEFHGGTKIYVPATRIGLVQKYIGGARTRPSLAKIGGKAWVRQKQAAESAVVDLAVEMLEMQAERHARPGIAFAGESDWQREFEASFPYHETPDQLTAMFAIRQDMETGRPMDRLLCGDVGFGKTELAMRAAFKAVDNGYQVAVLAPTTILVEQHYHTFRERMAEFPFDIARLSRFGTASEQREIVKRLAAGQVDIVIGTHRLASKDVKFHNLGLVVIDEEQRFGVEVKERLKTFRTTVDVLTLSATPIPRTLHMSLVGVRDISNLETPPEDRVATETRVTRFNHELIHRAVMRELSRGGQIYFVHNRVGDIRVVERLLNQIVPEASIRVGHGQMPEGELERVMVDFVEGKFDLLLATTIVESGLDIPNANTIFIDEANRYGLADLHQLRGRVGRYKHRAYCYLLIDPNCSLTPTASRRLRAIEEFSDMGAGFAIAMRDLEIRGAGNLLGTQQSGHIAAVGYELYCQLLESAVLSLKKMPPRLSIDVDIALPGEAYLPSDYVPDMRLKIDLYRKLSRVTSTDELVELRDELQDRFGPLPEPVQSLLAREQLKIEAAIWQISEIYREDRYLVFRYTNRSRIEQLARLGGGKLRVVDDSSAYLPIPEDVTDSDAIQETAKSVLQH
jgi:transcription-repair coupling factor (superfamily II helicase)